MLIENLACTTTSISKIFILESYEMLFSELLRERRKLILVCEKILTSFIDHFRERFPTAIIIPMHGGESLKSRASQEELEDTLLAHGVTKDSLIIACGGGALSDMVAFTASIYFRGMDLAIIPTTLLNMVDAAIGGKTALNITDHKNTIGTYYPAASIWICPEFISTLPQSELISGLAEVYKYGLIADPTLWDMLITQRDLLLTRDKKTLLDIIMRSVRCKTAVVRKDPEEKGLRRILNFGHTAGHAIEALSSYTLSHGEAVAIGLAVESYVSYDKGYLSIEELDTIYSSLAQVFPLQYPDTITLDALFLSMSKDKKALASSVRCVLIKEIGVVHPFNGEYVAVITRYDVEKALVWLASKKRLAYV